MHAQRVSGGPGIVYLVGSGPGDLQLLTLRANRVLVDAEVVVYDFLANERLLDLAPSAEKICVGKRGGNHTYTQNEINALLIAKVREGRRVVRLKGGDPFLFGRGGEEGEALWKAGLPFEVVPGITSALAVPAYAGIPVTERHHSASLAIVTGHEHPGKAESNINFQALAGMGTVVFLMGMKTLGQNMVRLQEAGVPGDRPAAAIQWGTRHEQRTVTATVETLAADVAAARLGPPGIVIVGEVVRMRKSLNWFEGRPWFGKRIVVTRSREANTAFLDALEHRGAEAIAVPTIAFEDPVDFSSMDTAIARLDGYEWLVFTSVNGVDRFWARLRHHGKDARALAASRIAAVGPATAKALEQKGLVPDLIPDAFRAEELARAMSGELSGRHVLLVRAEQGREVFREAAAAEGAIVDLAIAYRTVPATRPPALPSLLREGKAPDLIVFASPSAVKAFSAMLTEDEQTALVDAAAACIGPVTAEAAREAGFRIAVLPVESTVGGLMEAMDQFFQEDSPCS